MSSRVMIEQFKGTVYEQGYGTVAKRVMRDKTLSVGAKALYSYLCSFAWGKYESYPTVNSITNDMGISEKTFSRYRNEIVESGYVTVEFRNIRGQNRNVYILNSTPVKSSGVEKMTPSKNDPVQNDPPNNKRNTLQEKKKDLQEKKGTNEKIILDFIDSCNGSDKLKNKFRELIGYRKKIKKMYKTTTPLESLLKDLEKKIYTDEQNLMDCIDISIKNEYQGIFPNKKNAKKEDKFRRFEEL